MIDLYAWSTPNGFKPLIMLEETGLPYRLRRVDLRAGEQKSAEFLAINANGKIPAMVDDDAAGDSVTLSESGAILMYLADKSGQLLGENPKHRSGVVQWLMFQMSAVGPMFGQLGAFARADPKNPAATARFKAECERIVAVLETRLGAQDWLAGNYSIADISTFTWIRAADFVGVDLRGAPALTRWRDRIAARAAVQRALSAFDTAVEP